VVRQLNDFRNGERAGTLASLMALAVENLTDDDIVALSAYLGSLDP
jgi:cytochrome c553